MPRWRVQTINERLWSYITPQDSESCWVWQGTLRPDGYGVLRVGDKTLRVTRLLTNAKPDQVVRHKCDNPPCCNPAHLVLGTPADNNRDARERHRRIYVRRFDKDRICQLHSEGYSNILVAKMIGCSASYVSMTVNGKR